ncbi:MAG TPA: hypothetical protein VH413_16805 [Verrucomicrobiae bacterium]|jgi:hypothetical protein|nr:hypothetical protein [Verrucomicrobiae bacterium]
MNEQQEPKLDAPGAGLPKSELFVAKLLFAWRRFKGNRETLTHILTRNGMRFKSWPVLAMRNQPAGAC